MKKQENKHVISCDAQHVLAVIVLLAEIKMSILVDIKTIENAMAGATFKN